MKVSNYSCNTYMPRAYNSPISEKRFAPVLLRSVGTIRFCFNPAKLLGL